jgi:hypothetical protein
VILAEPTLNASGNVAEPAQVLATLASSRPRLVRAALSVFFFFFFFFFFF